MKANNMNKAFILLFIFFIIPSLALAGENTSAKTSVLESIDVLDLETAQRFAINNNPSMEAAAARVRSARDQVKQAASGYWPRLDTEISYARVNLSNSTYDSSLQTARFFNPNATVDNPFDNYTTGLRATWNLFSGFESKFSVAAATYGAKESRAGFQEGRRLLADAVAKSFYNALLARENIAIAQANKNYYEKLHQDAQERRRVGAGSLSTALTLEVQVNNANSQLISARNGYNAAIIGLAALMGLDGSLPKSVSLAPLENEKESEFTFPDAQELSHFALDHRPDVQLSEFRVGHAESNEKIAKSHLYPKLDLIATYNGERSDTSFGSDDFGDTVMLNLSFNIFSGGLNKRKVSAAKHEKTAALKDLENKKNTVAQEINTALTDLQSAQQQVILQRSNLNLVEKNRDLIKHEYDAGLALLVQLNEAQRDLLTTQSMLARSRVALKLAWHNLEIASGRNLEMIQTNQTDKES